MKHLFIVTYGKSGSTLLMDSLNTIPGWCLRGENGGALYDLYRHYTTLTGSQDHWSSGAPLPPTNPWFGIDEYPRWQARDMIRDLAVGTVMRPPPWATVTGFKEIRWDYPDLHDYLDWIEGTFPGARFIGNVRKIDDTIRSGWWKRTPDARGIVTARDMKVRDAITSRDARGYLVNYTEYARNPGKLADLFGWLGEPYDPVAIRHAFARSHGTDASSGGKHPKGPGGGERKGEGDAEGTTSRRQAAD